METTAAYARAEESPTDQDRKRTRALWALRVAAAWLMAGAAFKLFSGNPNFMPPLVRVITPFTLVLTYHLAISIELVLVSLALLKPRIAWAPIAALFVFFLVLLVDMLMKGQASCGCFGESFEMPPAVMLAIDGIVLAGVLATRPWSSLSGPGAPWAVVGTAIVVAIALPWLVIGDHGGSVAPVAGGNGAQQSSGSQASTPGSATHPGSGTQSNGSQSTTPAPSGTPTTGTTKTPPPPTDSSQKIWIELHPEKWAGKTIYDVAELTKYVSTDTIPSDGRIVFWRQGCTHCADHLRELANETITEPLLLVQVPDDLKDARAVDAMPSGANVTELSLPAGTVGLFETPFEVRIEGGVVKKVLFKDDFEKTSK